MSNEDMRKTREMPITETVADIYRTDPLGLYSHRGGSGCVICGAPVSGDIYCAKCLDLEAAEAEQAPPIYIAEGMEDDQ